MPTRMAASHAPIQSEWISGVRFVAPTGCANRLIEVVSSVEHDDTSVVAPSARATSATDLARLGSCRLKTEPLSQYNGRVQRYYWATGCWRGGRRLVRRYDAPCASRPRGAPRGPRARRSGPGGGEVGGDLGGALLAVRRREALHELPLVEGVLLGAD